MQEDILAIALHRHVGHTLVTVAGEIDIATAPQLCARLTELASSGQPVIVDLAQVSFSDAAGLRVLAAARQAAAASGSLQLAGPQPQMRRLLAISGLDSHIPVAATVAEARAALRAQPGTQPPSRPRTD